MTQYLMAVHGNEADYAAITPEQMQQMFTDVEQFNEKLRADNVWVFAGGLQGIATAAVVDASGDAPVVTDGPYLETKEHIGGFWVIDVPDRETALAYAAAGSKACQGKVEVRPFEDEPPADA
ncbi:MAG TPA: YciI family protein [Nocardioides sp.]|nr:YciI family protein [Nocardioides sp.]